MKSLIIALIFILFLPLTASGEDEILISAKEMSHCHGVYDGAAEHFKILGNSIFETFKGQSRGAQVAALVLFSVLKPVEKMGENLPIVQSYSHGSKTKILSYFELQKLGVKAARSGWEKMLTDCAAKNSVQSGILDKWRAGYYFSK